MDDVAGTTWQEAGVRRPVLRDRSSTLVEVWSADGTWSSPGGVLPDEEAAAADTMRSSAARQRHVRARTLLRLVVGRRLACDPSSVPLRPGGRPIIDLADAPGVGVAHAGDLVVVAVRGGGPVGVDVELLGSRRRPVPPVATSHGRSRLAARLGPGRDDPDLLAWVLQEAALKASGVGIGLPLREVELREWDDDLLVITGRHLVCRTVARRRGDALVAVAVPGTARITLQWHDAPTIR